jgi:hypothetical protein
MLKRRSRWLAGAAGLFLVLSMSGVAMGVTPPDAEPDAVVDTTATFEDIDGNGIDDDCQDEAAAEDPDAVAAELLTVDVNADGVISTTEAAHSARIGGKNCNHGGYVSWIAHQKHDCVEPTVDESTAPAEDETGDPGETVELVVTTPPDAEPDADAAACDESSDEADADSAEADHAAIVAARLAAKAERTLAHQLKKAEREAAHAAKKAERAAAKAEKAAERAAAKAARAENKGKHKNH